jgi:hypothetical protein
MSQSPDQPPQPVAVIPVAAAVLSYGRTDKRIHSMLLAALAMVAVMDAFGGVVFASIGLFALASPAGIRNIWLLVLGVLVFVPSVTIWIRTIGSWQISLVMMYLDGILLTLLTLAAVLRLWHDIGRTPTDSTMLNLFFGGLMGGLNLCGAYALCRSKRAFCAGHIDTVWCERFGLAAPIPLILWVIGFVILMKFYP